MSQTTFLNRLALHLRPDPSRVIVRPFKPSTEPRDLKPTDKSRANDIVERVLGLDELTTGGLLGEILENFDGRHRNLLRTFEKRADAMEDAFCQHATFSQKQRQLIGAYFMNEYSFEAAALFNPSIVPHPDQTGASPGALRFILSLRAVGEGHISSLTFRCGEVAADGAVKIDPPARLASLPDVTTQTSPTGDVATTLVFQTGSELSERVIFPVTLSQSNGIEDARFTRFEEDGDKTYYATFTAYNGIGIRSELISTTDFLTFNMMPLTGVAARNKGMALFPRRINGQYAMVARQDNENLYLIYSNDLLHWEGGHVLMAPKYPWEFVQIGNCGSPIELDEGWLLFTHGVGPVRRYSIGATLLDKNDPSKIIARSVEPILRPDPAERAGYVPNVVYTCGAMRLNDIIVLPYAVSDSYSNFATVRIADLLAALSPVM